MTLYAVEWIEVEYGWGDRPEGYKIFKDLEFAKEETFEDSENGNYPSGSGYLGPVRPLTIYEINSENLPQTIELEFLIDSPDLEQTCFVDSIDFKKIKSRHEI